MVKSGGLQPVLQAAVSNGLSLDPFSLGQDGWAASEVDVGRGEIVDALVVAAVVVVVDEGRDLGFEIAGQEVVFQQDGPFLTGLRHGLFCLGCCWMLMVLLFVGGAMNLAWITAIALLIVVEKTLPRGALASYAIAIVLIAWGAVTLTDLGPTG